MTVFPSRADLTRALAFVETLHGFDDLDAFAAHVLTALPTLIRCDVIGYNEVAPRHGRLHALTTPSYAAIRDFEDAWTKHQHEHPTFQHVVRTGDGSAWRISDFLTRRQFRATGIYADCYRQLGAEAQVSITLQSPPDVVVALAFNRGTGDFSEADRSLLNLLRPHLSRAYAAAAAAADVRRKAARAAAAMEGIDDGLLAVDRRGGITWATGRTRRILAEYFDVPDALPLPVRDWLMKTTVGTAEGDSTVIDAAPGRGRLIVRRLPGAAAGEQLLLLTPRRPLPATGEGLRRSLGLTPREADVLRAMMRGRTNAEIARDLGCRPWTVDKHVEHLFRKLDVTTRTAAVAQAMRSLGAEM